MKRTTKKALRAEVMSLRRERNVFQQQQAEQAAATVSALNSIAMLRGELQGVQSENNQLKGAINALAVKAGAREQGLKASLDMLKKSVDYYVIDAEFRGDYVMLSKASVADYLLKLARTEEP